MAGKKKRKKQQPRKHFKVNLERIARHIGKIIDNTKLKDVTEASLYASLAYLSYSKLTTRDEEGKVEHHIQNALFGPIALRLATTPGGGFGSPSQIAGLAGLGVLGLVAAADAEGGFKAPIGPKKELVITFGEPCPDGYRLMTSNFGFNYCMRIPEKETGVPEPYAPKGEVG